MSPTPLDYVTYELLQPVGTHRRAATCEEAGCRPHHDGWSTSLIPGSTDEALILATCRGEVDGIRRPQPTPTRTPEGFNRYVVPAGTPCFKARTHTVLLDRPAFGIRRDGNKLGVGSDQLYQHSNLDEWVEDFGDHQQGLADEAAKG